MALHLVVWVAIGSVAALAAWLCLLAGAEGEILGDTIDREVLPAAEGPRLTAVPSPEPAERVRRIADPEYGLLTVREDEAAAWFPSAATA